MTIRNILLEIGKQHICSFLLKIFMSFLYCRPGAGRVRGRKRGRGAENDAVGLASRAVEAVRILECELHLV